MVVAKQIVPRVMEKTEEWKGWKEEVEDYCEAVSEGMKEMLAEAKSKKEAIEEANMDKGWWDMRGELWRLLKRYSTGEANKNHQGSGERQWLGGLEAVTHTI